MRGLYLEPFSGISGDMLIGALLDLGLDFDQFKAELAKLNVTGYHLVAEKTAASNIYGTSFDVLLDQGTKDTGFHEAHQHDHHHHARHLSDILALIDASDLKPQVKTNAKAIFNEIGRAEGYVHHVPMSEVHFHEVGALDSIVDIVGCCVAIDLLGIETIKSAPLSDGQGFINVAHGQMPVPVPAVAQMLVDSQVPFKQREDVQTELVTPTGMGFVKTMVSEFGRLTTANHIKKVGYGFGKRQTGSFNALRVMLFENAVSSQTVRTTNDQVTLIETNLDNQTGEGLGFAMQQLLAAGALDVFLTPIQMKKNRPAQKLSVLVTPSQVDAMAQKLFQLTTAKGLRYQTLNRKIMQRHFETIATAYGPLKIKIAQYGAVIKRTPEYDDCAQIASQRGLSLEAVYRTVQQAIQQHFEEEIK
ncbi:nickel pincer cofactor biosynthesis protein LarC [Lactiplantibacillus daowaiensis]|uniref:Pyridinium-3,5-bisthiocarboxylic acid mononucleotide nickel insertion protein n=1 Tax=Lactiplantibacillus daowaiensis TaxID=2559918 RepID=A0ABW1RX05_9LACO|nr:nickel pincer cofactor biosynthesis protein LarC [Lactiplantibacillus daowaiensis]